MTDLNKSNTTFSLKTITFKQAIWLTPVAYLVHIIEEAGFEFHSFVNDHMGAEMSFKRFLVANSVIMAVYIGDLALHTLLPNRVTAVLVLLLVLSAQFANTFVHLILTIGYGQFCPGLVSALVLYVPLSGIILYRAYLEQYISKKSGAVLVVLGFVLMGVFFYASMFGARISPN